MLDVLEEARRANVKFVRLQFVDIFGALKNVAVTVEDLPEVLRHGMLFDASVVEGVTPQRQTDMLLRPDPDTFTVFPWRPREGAVARLICDLYTPQGEVFPCSSRLVLRRVIDRASSIGLAFSVATEAEFFLFQVDDRGQPTLVSHDRAGYCDLTPMDLGENARRDMVLTLQEMGLETASSHHELAPGQHEICFKATDPLTAADQFETFKFVVRTIAQRHGLHASFMPKPFRDQGGSGLHWRVEATEAGRNAFFDPENEAGPSSKALAFIGGVLFHAPAGCVVTNPLINSYKRLVPSDVAPTYVAWSDKSRNAILRVPLERGNRTLVEIRHPDPTCNPYLALALMLAAGIEGIEKGIDAPPPVPENMHQADNQRRAEPHVASLPRSLGEALQLVNEDSLLKEILGEPLLELYLDAKSKEWERFLTFVHPWEVEEYLSAY